MNQLTHTDRHFRVVRYYPEYGLGVSEDILGSHLTMDEAEKLAGENPPIVSDEEIAIEDEEASNFSPTVKIYRK